MTHAAALDLLVLEVSCDPQPDTSDFYDLPNSSLCLAESGDKLVVAGYPQLINEIQYPDENQDGKNVNGSGDGDRGGVIGSLVEPRTQTCLDQRQEIRG